MLSCDRSYVPDTDLMSFRRPIRPYVLQSSFGAHSNETGLAGGQGAAAALLQGDAPAHGLHHELVHSRTGLGGHDLAVGRLADR